MGSFSVWHWLIMLGIIGVIIWIVRQAVSRSPADQSELRGIGGWLALLAFGQVIALLSVVVTSLQNFETYGAIIDLPGAKVAIYTELGVNVVLIALVFSTTIALFKKKAAFIRLYMYQWLATPVVFAINLLIVSAAFGISASALINAEDVATMILAFFAGGAWVWYTRASTRVANTMIN